MIVVDAGRKKRGWLVAVWLPMAIGMLLAPARPANFARTCDVDDLIPSVIAAAGCIIGTLYRLRGERPC